MSAHFILVHLPHIIPAFAGLGFIGRFAAIMANQPPAQLDDAELEAWRRSQAEAAYSRRVRSSTSKIGLIVLLPLLYAFGSGLAVYTIALDGGTASSLLSWSHAIVSTAALLIVTWKLVDLGAERMRRGLRARAALTDGASVLLAALGLPLLVTGIVLVAVPSTSSAAAYVHLIAGVWWGLLLGMHLMRYLGRALAAALRGKAAPEGRSLPQPSAGAAPHASPR